MHVILCLLLSVALQAWLLLLLLCMALPVVPCCTGFQVRQHIMSTCLKTWSESPELPFNEILHMAPAFGMPQYGTSTSGSLLPGCSATVKCGILQHGACLQVATAAFKTLMALLGDTHQYEALLGCRSSLPTGQSLRAFWYTSEAFWNTSEA